MYTVKTLPEFDNWLNGLKDRMTKQRLSVRLRKATLGNLGDVKPVGDGVYEMREHFGPGWRMYYANRGETLIMMLGGGDKGTQKNDIATAKQRNSMLED
uniref:type II toxin-antitoxin system RelE/ParE family toxin n=1 Tax=Candidatus Electronema sp. TaxID=2698783 RepID=UPI004056411D